MGNGSLIENGTIQLIIHDFLPVCHQPVYLIPFSRSMMLKNITKLKYRLGVTHLHIYARFVHCWTPQCESNFFIPEVF